MAKKRSSRIGFFLLISKKIAHISRKTLILVLIGCFLLGSFAYVYGQRVWADTKAVSGVNSSKNTKVSATTIAKNKKDLQDCQKMTQSYNTKTKAILERSDPVVKQGFWANVSLKAYKWWDKDSGGEKIESNMTYRERIKVAGSNAGNLDSETKKIADVASKTNNLVVCKKLLTANINFYQHINRLVQTIANEDGKAANEAIVKINKEADLTNKILKDAAMGAVITFATPLVIGGLGLTAVAETMDAAAANIIRVGFSKLLPLLVKGATGKAAQVAANQVADKIAKEGIAKLSQQTVTQGALDTVVESVVSKATAAYIKKVESELTKRVLNGQITEAEKRLALEVVEKDAAKFSRKIGVKAVNNATKAAKKIYNARQAPPQNTQS